MNAWTLPTEWWRARPGPVRLTLAGWALAAAAVLVQGTAEQLLAHGTVGVEFLLRWRVYPVTLWAAATPGILAAARRWPVTRRRWPTDLPVHGILCAVWMVVSNGLLRVPELVAGGAAAGRAVMAAAVEHAPAGALVWIVLVGFGRRGDRVGDDGAIGGDAPSGPLSLRVGYHTRHVERDAVRWIEADGDYLNVHTTRRTHRIRGPLKTFLRELEEDRFLRIHRSTVVNLDFVREVQPLFHGDHVAILRDGTELRVPRSRRAAIRKLRGMDRRS